MLRLRPSAMAMATMRKVVAAAPSMRRSNREKKWLFHQPKMGMPIPTMGILEWFSWDEWRFNMI